MWYFFGGLMRILVIEDEASIGKLLQLLLTRAGFDVVVTRDGAQGMAAFENDWFDVVITDIRMPVMDGKEVLARIRQSDRPHTPVVGITGTTWQMDKGDFDSVIAKPFTLTTVLDTIQNICCTQQPARATG